MTTFYRSSNFDNIHINLITLNYLFKDESITSEDEDEFVLEEKVTAIQEKIFENPYVYKNHIDLLSILQ